MRNPFAEMKKILTPTSWTKFSWRKWNPKREEFQYCLSGAMTEVRPSVPDLQYSMIERYLIDAIRVWQPGRLVYGIPIWNDMPGRKYEDIQAVLDIAEKQWQADHE